MLFSLLSIVLTQWPSHLVVSMTISAAVLAATTMRLLLWSPLALASGALIDPSLLLFVDRAQLASFDPRLTTHVHAPHKAGERQGATQS
jgi:hypothetical protein